MKKEELQRIITELQKIKEEFENEGIKMDTLIRLVSCMGNLRKYHKYFERSEGILEMIKEYQLYSKDDFIYVIEKTVDMLNEDLETGENLTVFESIKKGYEDVKDIVSAVISEEFKTKCGETINTANIIGAGITNKIKKEVPLCVEKVEKRVKSKFRNWLLSEEDEN